MARFIVGDYFVGKFDDGGGLFGFSRVEGADAVAVDWLFSHEFGGFAAKILEKPALNDCIQILFGLAGFLGFVGEALMFGNIARKPIMGANHRLFDEFFVGGIDGLVESHVDIGANFPLGLHGDFRIHANFVAVDM